MPRCCTPSLSQSCLWPTLPVSLNLVFIFPCISHKYSAGCFFMVHSFLEILEDLKFILCVPVHVVCTYYVGFRWQLAGASSLLVPQMFRGLHSSHQARRQALLPSEPSPQAKCSSYKSINSILPQLAFPLPAASVRSMRVGACRGHPRALLHLFSFLSGIPLRDWRDGSEVKSTYCVFRGHRFSS